MKKYIIPGLIFLISLVFLIYDLLHVNHVKMYMVGLPISLIGIGLIIILNNKTHNK